MRLAILYALCAVWDAAVLVVTLPLWLFGVERLRRHAGVLWLDVRRASLLARRWRYSTTLGHVVLLQPGLIGSDVETHELVHVRQFEGAVCSVWLALAALALTYSLTGPRLACALVLLLAPWWSYAGASLAAALRGQQPYLDNHYERHARAETELQRPLERPSGGVLANK